MDEETTFVKKVYFEDCPGCMVDRQKAAQQIRLPIMKLFIIWIVVLATGKHLVHLFLYRLILDLKGIDFIVITSR